MMFKRLVFSLSLLGCVQPHIAHVELAPPTERIALRNTKPTIVEYCVDQNADRWNHSCSVMDQALVEGIKANDYQFIMMCKAVDYAFHFYWRSDIDQDGKSAAMTKYMAMCAMEKGSAYKEQAVKIKSDVMANHTCVSADELAAGFDTGYYCASHSFEFWRSKKRFIETVMDICQSDKAHETEASCSLIAQTLYQKAVQENGDIGEW